MEIPPLLPSHPLSEIDTVLFPQKRQRDFSAPLATARQQNSANYSF